MLTNKNHWYDGWFFDRLIAPNQDSVFARVKDLVDGGSTLLDVGCGTGRLVFQLSDRCSRVDGIDLSIRNIDTANKRLQSSPVSQISFYHENVEDFFLDRHVSYDYAVVSYVLHEIDAEKRSRILIELSSHVKKIITMDYFWIRPDLLSGMFNDLVEFAAGLEHYRNFRSYMAQKGLSGLAEQSDLRVLDDIRNYPPGSHIMVLAASSHK